MRRASRPGPDREVARPFGRASGLGREGIFSEGCLLVLPARLSASEVFRYAYPVPVIP